MLPGGVAGTTWLLNHVLDATTAEAFALQKGLELVENIGCSPDIVESDSLELEGHSSLQWIIFHTCTSDRTLI